MTLSLSADFSGGTAVHFPLEITPEMFLASVSPRIVPASSGTQEGSGGAVGAIGGREVTLSGAGFYGASSEALRCAFDEIRTGYGGSSARVGTSYTRVRFIDERRVLCAPPAPTRGQATEMALSLVDAQLR